jgi:hypothetical protein
MSISDLFRRLGAPLANHMWSWGAVRASDGAVFLRVWQDRERKIDGRWYTMVLSNVAEPTDPGNLGRLERIRQLELICNGARCYFVMCEAKDPKAAPRSIRSFNERDVFVGGAVVEMDGDWWIERAARISARELMPTG